MTIEPDHFFDLEMRVERLHYRFMYFKSNLLNRLEKDYCESDELYLSFAFLKMELEDLLDILGGITEHWTNNCDCLVNLAEPMDYAIQMMEQLFKAYPIGHAVANFNEAQTIGVFQRTYKKAYQIHKMLIHGLKECREGHLLPWRSTCCVCRRRLFFQRNHLYDEFFLDLLRN